MAAKTKRRRASGEGTVRLRKDGRWEARLVIGYAGGKEQTRSVYGKTQAEAIRKLELLKQQRAQGLPLKIERQTTGQFLQHWLEHVAAARVRPTSLHYYRRRIEQLSAQIGQIPLGLLQPQQVQAALSTMLQAGIAPRTVANARLVLVNALNTAVTWELIGRNVAARTSPPRVETFEGRVLTADEVQRVIARAREQRLALAVAIALGALGMRRGEVLGLRWSDVDLDSGTLRIVQTLITISGAISTGRPKSRTSARTLPLPAGLQALVRERHVEMLADRVFAGADWQDNGLVVATWTGRPFVELSRRFGAVLKQCGLPHVRFHDLRHSCASLLAAEGMSTRAVMEWLGHATPAMALHYTHVAEQQRQQSAGVLNALFGEKEDEREVG